MTKQTQPAAEPKRRRTIDEQIAALEAKKAQQQLWATAREALSTLTAEVRSAEWPSARASLAILSSAIDELEKAGA